MGHTLTAQRIHNGKDVLEYKGVRLESDKMQTNTFVKFQNKFN
jgi:hypothetical protein